MQAKLFGRNPRLEARRSAPPAHRVGAGRCDWCSLVAQAFPALFDAVAVRHAPGGSSQAAPLVLPAGPQRVPGHRAGPVVAPTMLPALATALVTPLPRYFVLMSSRSSTASCSPVEAPLGTAAHSMAPPARCSSASTVGFPRESGTLARRWSGVMTAEDMILGVVCVENRWREYSGKQISCRFRSGGGGFRWWTFRGVRSGP